jgi:hypothetical protein
MNNVPGIFFVPGTVLGSMSGHDVWIQIHDGSHSQGLLCYIAVGEVAGVDLSIDLGNQTGLCYRKSFGMKLEYSEIGHLKQKV